MATIVSGFTQRFRDHSFPLGSVQDHEHCFSCVRQTCRIQADNVKSCEHIKCPRGCGLHYHACKEAEHSLLCLEERVACINQINGCPVVLLRKKMSQHISVCPASVVTCNAEWNRFPLYPVKEDKNAIPVLPKVKTYVDCGQLDVACALRDQRALIDMNSAPQQTRHQLRSHFNQKNSSSQVSQHSAAYQADFSVFTERVNGECSRDSAAQFDTNHQTLRLENSLHNLLVDASKETVNSLTSALDIVSNHMALTDQAHSEEQSLLQLTDRSQVRATGCGQAVFPDKRISSDASSLLEGEPTFPDACSSRDFGQGGVISREKQGQTSKKDTTMNAGIVGQVVKDGQPLHQLLNISISVESITKYQPKPPNMYTFLCSHVFRRDQFVHHFRNVHCEIQAGMNGWMEQRCPLAYLGCPFSFRRFQPSVPDSSICHSWLLESFGLVTNCVANQPLHQTPIDLLSSKTGRQGFKQNEKDRLEMTPEQSTSSLEDVGSVSAKCPLHSHMQIRMASVNDGELTSASCSVNPENVPSLWNLHSVVETDETTFVSPISATTEPKSGWDCFNSNEKTSARDTSFACSQHGKIFDRPCLDIESKVQRSHSSADSLSHSQDQDNEGPATTNGCTGTAKESQAVENQSQGDSGSELLRPVIYTGYSWDSPIRVTHVPLLASKDCTFRSRAGPALLTDLPTEVLRHIAHFLDSFSLFNLSLVSRLLRDICCSLLEELGIVVLIWERQILGQRVSWHVVGKRWTFSTSFHSIRSWEFSGHSPISQHLLKCPYNQDKVINTKPFSLIPQTEMSVDQQLRSLSSSYLTSVIPPSLRSREGREQNRRQDRWRGSFPNWYAPVLFDVAEAAGFQRAVAEEPEENI